MFLFCFRINFYRLNLRNLQTGGPVRQELVKVSFRWSLVEGNQAIGGSISVLLLVFPFCSLLFLFPSFLPPYCLFIKVH